jgi:hypothetical protein
MDSSCEGHSVEMLWLLGRIAARISSTYLFHTSVPAHFGGIHFNQHLDSVTGKAHGSAEARTESALCQHDGSPCYEGILSGVEGILYIIL